MPIELHYELEPEVEETMKRNLADIVESLSKKYGWVSDKSLADDYVILLEVLKFVLQQRKKLAKHFDIHDGDAEECDEDHEGSCCGSCFNSVNLDSNDYVQIIRMLFFEK